MAITTPAARIERAVLFITIKRVQKRKSLESPRGAALLSVQDIEIKGSGRAYICADANRGVK